MMKMLGKIIGHYIHLGGTVMNIDIITQGENIHGGQINHPPIDLLVKPIKI